MFFSVRKYLICEPYVIFFVAAGFGCKWLNVPFSNGDFKSVTVKARRRAAGADSKDERRTAAPAVQPKAATPEEELAHMGVYSCLNEGCVRVFQRSSNLERHLSFEKCAKSLERQSLLDLATTQYAALLLWVWEPFRRFRLESPYQKVRLSEFTKTVGH